MPSFFTKLTKADRNGGQMTVIIMLIFPRFYAEHFAGWRIFSNFALCKL